MQRTLLTLFSSSLLALSAWAQNPGKSEADEVRFLLAPSVETTLAATMTGRVIAVNASLGQAVGRGKVVVVFDCEEQSARMRMSQAEQNIAQQAYENKVRLQGLEQAAEIEVAQAASALERAKAQVTMYRAQLGQCSVVAPFSGRVVKVTVKPHQGVTAGQPLLELVSDGALKLRLNAPAKWVAWLKPGTSFDVHIDETGRNYKARVSAVNGRIDAVSQSIELEATIDERAPDLLPGMSGAARFNTAK